MKASPVSLELGILLLIRTGWKDFDSHRASEHLHFQQQGDSDIVCFAASGVVGMAS